MYEGSIRLTYLDKAHKYYRQDRINYGLSETDELAWGKKFVPKGTTTLLGDTLEKKGLMTWPMGVALRELFGFYDFTNERGEQMTGFSKGVGTLWSTDHDYQNAVYIGKSDLLPLVLSASKGWQRRQKSGADIGSLVHDAIEQHVLGKPFELTLERYTEGQEFPSAEARQEWLAQAPKELKMAQLAFGRFAQWWETTKPTLIGAEQIIYSKKHDVAGAYDAVLGINGQRVLADWKTSAASVSAGAPEGVYYSYFIQSAIYAGALMEMGEPPIDDLMIVSARKDGEFATIRASEVGLSMEEALKWAGAVIFSYRMMEKTKKGLLWHAEQALVN